MKNLLLSAFFVLAFGGTALAQCNPGGNGWGNGSAWGQGGNPQAQAQPITTIPAWVALRVCQSAQPALFPFTGMNTLQLFSAYRAGTATITYLGVDPADQNRGLYQVNSGGGTVVISIIDGF
jgi:hypothetical protein